MKTSHAQLRSGPRGGSFSFSAMIGLGVLLIIPICALNRLTGSVDVRVLVGLPLALSSFTFLGYWSDKRRAQAGGWRIPESTLHLAELVGGWPGAFLGQRILRHKTAKTSYQVVFWFIVTLHQLVALDALLAWKFSHGLWRFVQA